MILFVEFESLFIMNEYTHRDLWKMKDLVVMQNSVTAAVVSHGVVMHKITPTSDSI